MNKFLIVLTFCALFISLVESIDRKKDCDCKVQRNHGTNISSYSWIANLYEDNVFICSGTIVNELYVIFSTNCVKNANNNFSITVGEIKKDEKLEKISKSDLIKVRFVSTYTPSDSAGLALMQLDSPINFSDKTIKASPACLSRSDRKKYSLPFNLIGFSSKNELKEVSHQDISDKVGLCPRNSICSIAKKYHSGNLEIEFNSSGLAHYNLGDQTTTVIGLIDGPSKFDNKQINLVRIGSYFKIISNHLQGNLC